MGGGGAHVTKQEGKRSHLMRILRGNTLSLASSKWRSLLNRMLEASFVIGIP
jgi:hypothetical protein